ncbi:multidrug efflux pump subunit AcrB [Paraburkholderia sp. CI3]
MQRPYTFIVLAVLLFSLGPLAIMRTPKDIFPNIDIPVVSIVWSCNGFSTEDMAHRITSNYERALTTDVDDIEHIESQSLNGVSVVKIFFSPRRRHQSRDCRGRVELGFDLARAAAGHAADEHHYV